MGDSKKHASLVKHYIKQVKNKYTAGGSTEHSYRGDLQNLLNEMVSNIKVINEPKRQEFGAPDYVIKRKDIPIGYIEAKDIGVDLSKVERSAQMERYLKSLDNLVLTDYLEFRFFRYGEKIKEIKIASEDGKFKTYPDMFALFIDYLQEFCMFEGQTITSAEKLAKIMAQKARIMEEVLLKAVKTEHDDKTLRNQYEAFKEILIHDLTEENFADIYAQTITYGMFAARLHDPKLETFSRFEAAQLIPKSNPFLRKLFQYIAGYDLDDRIAWIVEALADVFRVTDVATLINKLGDVTKQNDPMIHLYETFLAEYDPKLRKKRGVFYTPEPVVNFIVRAVDDILKSEFDLSEGLADNSKTDIKVDVQGKKEKTEVHKVQILDPAVGTGTFLAEIIKQIYQKYKTQQGIWNDYVENHLIPRLNGFELLMAPYAMAHLKLDLLLSETGYKPSMDQRLKIFLTNALEEHHPDTGTIFASWLSQEANDANFVKRDTPVMVVLGNPPYSGISSNIGKWITNLIEDYKYVDGEHFGEKKHWLQDDYVKFLRYGHHFIEENKEGVLAFINNHGFLDNPTFRGMRYHLLKTFDKIYIIDLHGNAKKKEVCPDGSPDENVFDIQQGVSINIFVRTKKKRKERLAKVYHYDLYGSREHKYEVLQNNYLQDVEFTNVQYDRPYYFFITRDNKNLEKYKRGFQVSELFSVFTTGVVTARDKFVIDIDKVALLKRIQHFVNPEIPDDVIRQTYFGNKKMGRYLPGDSRGWKLTEARKTVKDYEHENIIERIAYRPFDNRYIYYSSKMVDWGRENVMQHFLKGKNIGLVITRQGIGSNWYNAFVTKYITDDSYVSNKTRERGYVNPLYLYEEENTILSEIEQPNRKPNLNMAVINRVADNLNLRFTPEKEETEGTFAPIDILDYIYAVLHSPNYREKYKEFLKIDFPHIPYPNDKETFWELVKLGEELRQIHLLESPVVEDFITSYPEDGSNEVEKVKYDNGKVFINDQQYFDNVSQVAWEFYIGGYQPAQKWLKDRKGRLLGFDDVRHYHKIIKALVETNRLMEEIDILIEL